MNFNEHKIREFWIQFTFVFTDTKRTLKLNLIYFDAKTTERMLECSMFIVKWKCVTAIIKLCTEYTNHEYPRIREPENPSIVSVIQIIIFKLK